MDDDLLLAIQLQEQYDREAGEEPWQPPQRAHREGGGGGSGRPPEMCVVDPAWELLDPSPDIRALFLQFNDMFFWGKLAGVEVKWSPRMTLCAGVCSYEGFGGLCSIRLSKPLLVLRPRKDLVQTLLHEMIHALLFVTQNNRDRDGHGPEFLKHMNRINGLTGASISVYHSFHDEVDEYRKHWWRCNGPCQERKPYFGYVKRAMNRAPSFRDPWWADHQRTCGGTYIKIKEPEPTQKGKSKEASAGKGFKQGESSKSVVKSNIQNPIFFPVKNKEASAGKGLSSSQSVVKGNIQNAISSPVKNKEDSAGKGVKLGESSQSVVKSNIHNILSSPGKHEDAPKTLFPGKGFVLGGRPINKNPLPSSGASPSSIPKSPINMLKFTTPLADKGPVSKVPKISVANTRAFINVGGSPVKLPFNRTIQKVGSPAYKSNFPSETISSSQSTPSGSQEWKRTSSATIASSQSIPSSSQEWKRTSSATITSSQSIPSPSQEWKRTSSATITSSQSVPSTSQERKSLGEFQPHKKPRMEVNKNIKDFFQGGSVHSVQIPKKPVPERPATETIPSSQRMVSCPVCQKEVPEANINTHLDGCLT